MEASRIKALLEKPLSELIALANSVREKEAGRRLDLCTIMNAKSGLCSENCKFCAQSCHHSAKVDTYPLKDEGAIIAAARRAKDIGAGRFGIVTSGNTLTRYEVKRIADAVSKITGDVGIRACASLGKLDREDLLLLKGAGLSRYHHNIETSARYYPHIVTTHTFQDRIEMIRTVKSAGLEICSGGIIGMGETLQDRIEMALLLKELDVDSVPVNILIPIKGTPLEGALAISCADALRTIALYRIILKDKTVKLAAGRENRLKDFQAMAFMAGANGMLIGGYLTVQGRPVEDDWDLIREVEKAW